MAPQVASNRDIRDVSNILQLALLSVSRCRDSAVASSGWKRIPHNDLLRILNVAVGQRNLNCEFEVFCHADEFIRSHGRAGLMFVAGRIKAACAHELAARIVSEFLELMFQGNFHDYCISAFDADKLFTTLASHLEEEDASFIRNSLCGLPEFDAEELAIRLQQEAAFVVPADDSFAPANHVAEQLKNKNIATPSGRANHSADFASVNWFGTPFEFTPNQAACVKVLWEAWENGTPTLGEAFIIEQADVSQGRIDKVFRKKIDGIDGLHPAFGTMIVKASSDNGQPLKGRWRLNPVSTKTPT